MEALISKMKNKTLPTQSLETSTVLAIAAILISFAEGERSTAAGIAIGSGLAMFSLWTFIIAVPRLFAARNPYAPFLLGILTAIKLPTYAIVLMIAFSSLQVGPFAVFTGAALIPCVIAANAIGQGMASRGSRPHGLGSAR